MQSITLHSHAGQDGVLKIEVPIGKPNTEWEVVVVIHPATSIESKMNLKSDSEFESLVNYGNEQIHKVCAERKLNWDTLNEEARIKLIDEILHEA